MRLGSHMMTSNGLSAAAERAYELGCETIQIFSRSPRMWGASALNTEEISKFQKALKTHSIFPLAIHGSYLMNFASPNPELYARSIEGLILELERAEAIGADYLVIHLGSHTGSGEAIGLKRVADAVTQAFQKTSGRTMLLLENTAGQGNVVGGPFEHLQQLLETIGHPGRLGICFDTCHAFQAGYDLSSESKAQDVLKKFEALIGFDRLHLFHGNDAKAPLGAGLDRHWHIGEGHIGTAGFKVILNHPKLKDKALILETPKDKFQEEDRKNLATLRTLIKKQP